MPLTLEERLRFALTASQDPRPEGVDMSAEAITSRLMELAEMSSLCLALGDLGRARLDGPTSAA